MHKTHLTGFVLEILFIRDYSSTFYLFDGKARVAKFQMYNDFSFEIIAFRKRHTLLPRHLVNRYLKSRQKRGLGRGQLQIDCPLFV